MCASIFWLAVCKPPLAGCVQTFFGWLCASFLLLAVCKPPLAAWMCASLLWLAVCTHSSDGLEALLGVELVPNSLCCVIETMPVVCSSRRGGLSRAGPAAMGRRKRDLVNRKAFKQERAQGGVLGLDGEEGEAGPRSLPGLGNDVPILAVPRDGSQDGSLTPADGPQGPARPSYLGLARTSSGGSGGGRGSPVSGLRASGQCSPGYL
jgi:hypothetical protein